MSLPKRQDRILVLDGLRLLGLTAHGSNPWVIACLIALLYVVRLTTVFFSQMNMRAIEGGPMDKRQHPALKKMCTISISETTTGIGTGMVAGVLSA